MASAAQVLVQKIPTKLEVLELYKNLLMGRKTFKYTDPNWYTKKIRHEFKKNKELQDPEKLAKYYRDAVRVFQNNWGGLM